MTETIEEKIERFKVYNRTLIAAAVSKKNRRYQGLPAKLLLCSIFDSLSIAAFPNEDKVGKRYKQTIADHTEWKDHDRVSLLQLNGVMKRIDNISSNFEILKNWVSVETSKKFPSTTRMLSTHTELNRDPFLSEVLAHWPMKADGTPEKLGKLWPEDLTHRGLFWKYRNKLAHEFRLPGRGAQSPFRWEHEPYYQEMSTITNVDPVNGLIFDNHWELIYPTGFFLNIFKESLDSIYLKYMNEKTSPFLLYDESNLWL